jgi:type IV secretion system protein VirB1
VLVPMAIFAQLSAACAPGVSAETLAAVARTESGFDALAVGDNTARHSYHPASQQEAIDLAQRLMDEGHNLDLGMMQINSGNFGWLGLTVETAFDPCQSLRAGATVLAQLSRYNSGSPTASLAYAVRVISAEKGGTPTLPHSTPTAVASEEQHAAAPHRWLAFSDPAEDNWESK